MSNTNLFQKHPAYKNSGVDWLGEIPEGWGEIHENQREKIVKLINNVKAHPDFKIKVADNKDKQNSDIAFERIVEEIINKQSRKDLDFLRLFAKDSSFRHSLMQTIKGSLQLD